jgi:hypothetical protein
MNINSVQKMLTSKGNKAANQVIIYSGSAEYFRSYDTYIAKKENGRIFLDTAYWDYSSTTGKYRNIFLGEGIADTRKKIKSGEYKLIDLNQ